MSAELENKPKTSLSLAEQFKLARDRVSWTLQGEQALYNRP